MQRLSRTRAKGETPRNDKGKIANIVEKDLRNQEEEEKEEKRYSIFMISLESIRNDEVGAKNFDYTKKGFSFFFLIHFFNVHPVTHTCW